MGCCNTCGMASCEGCESLCGPGDNIIDALAGTVDCVRNLNTVLGARPYKVYLVWTCWSGGSRHEGVEQVIREEELTPVPMVQSIGSLSQELSKIGLDEEGSLTVSEISPRYNEHYLMGRDEEGRAIPDDQNFYWEIYYPSAVPGVRRRFFPASAPDYQATKFQWTMRLKKTNEDRQYDGSARG